MRESRANGDTSALIILVRAGLVRGLGGITDARLYSHCYVGTKVIVETYVDEVCAALQYLVEAPAHEFSPVWLQLYRLILSFPLAHDTVF